MKIEDIKGLTLQEKFRKVAEFAGIPADMLDRQWMVESGRGKNMTGQPVKVDDEVVQAQGHFQFIPETRRSVAARMGVSDFDPYDLDSSLVAAGYLWKANMASAGGDTNVAAALYFAGPNRKKWGPLTDDYVKKVAKGQLPAQASRMEAPEPGADPTAGILTVERALAGLSQEIEQAPRVDYSGAAYVAANQASSEAQLDRVAAEAQAEAGKGSLFATATADPSISGAIALLEAYNRPSSEPIPDNYSFDQELPKLAQQMQLRESEIQLLQEYGPQGPAHRDYAIQRINADREREATYGAYGPWEVLGAQLAAGVADPVGWAVGFGVFKGMQLAKVGSGALARAGRPGAAVASAAAEGAVGGVAFEGILDGLGEQRTAGDYLLAAGFGAGLGGAFSARGAYRQAAEAAANAEFDSLTRRVFNEDFVGPLTPDEQALRDNQAVRGELARNARPGDRVIPEDIAEDIEATENPKPEEEAIPTGEATELDIEPPVAAALSPQQTVYETIRNAVASIGPAADFVWAKQGVLQSREDGMRAGRWDAALTTLTGQKAEDLFNRAPGLHRTADGSNPGLNQAAQLLEDLRKKWLPHSSITLAGKTTQATSQGEIVTMGKGHHVIGIDVKNLTPRQIRRVVIHEFGHAVFHEKLGTLTGDQLFRLRTAQARFLELYQSQDLGARAMRLSASDDIRVREAEAGNEEPPLLFSDEEFASVGKSPQQAKGTREYSASANEFAAEQFVKYLETEVKAGRIDYITDHILAKMKEFLDFLVQVYNKRVVGGKRGASLKPEAEFHQVLNEILDSVSKDATGNLEAQFPQIDVPDLTSAAQPIGGRNPGAVISNKRKLTARIVQAADDFLRANPIDTDRVNVLTQRFGGALSDGLKLAGSKSKVLQMVAALVTETTTQVRRDGDKRTVTLRAHTLKSYLSGDGLPRFQSAYDSWRNRNGGSIAEDMFGGAKRLQFNREVMLEMLARREPNYVPSQDVSVRSAADALEEGFERARKQQVDSNVLGAANLPTDARGYVPQALNGRVLAEIPASERIELERHLGRRFAAVYGWQRDFAEDVARTYVTRERNRATGGEQFPTAAEDPASPIKESLEDMKRGASGPRLTMIQQAEVAFSDRGMGQTKKRLDVGLADRLPNGKMVLDYYVDDPAVLYQRYMHRTAGNVAFTEFGVQGPVGLRYLREAAEEEGVTREEIEAFDRVVAELMGRPVPGAVVSEPALAARLLVGTQRLGSLVFTQAAEVFNMLHHLGLRSLLAANVSIPKMVSEVGRLKKGLPSQNRLLTSIETMSGPIGMDMYRMKLPLDAPDDRLIAYSADQSLVTRLLQGASHLQQKVSFFRGLMAAQHRAVAEQIVLKSVRYIREGGPANDKYLTDMGFTPQMVQQLRAATTSQPWYTVGPDNRVQSLDVTALPPELAHQYVQAVHRGVGQIIQQTFTGERGAWLHNDYAQLLLQLRTFGLTAMEKQWGRTVSNSGYAKAAGIILGQMALAAPIHLARVHAQSSLMGDKERDEYVKQNTNPAALARAAMNYSSTSALFGDAWEVASAFGAGWAERTGVAGGDFSETIGVRGGTGGAVSRAVPIAGSIDQAAKVLSGQGSLYQGLKQLPGSNLWFIAPIIGLTKDSD